MIINRKLIFDAAKRRGAVFKTRADVADMDAAIDAAYAGDIIVTGHRRASPKGIALIHSFEKCMLEAYPDPGSKDGHPWTIGWGSTGPDIYPGVVWTKAQCDARFDRDIVKYETAVDNLTRDVLTNQNQFDAMVSLCYNIGIGSANPLKKGGFTRSSVLRNHRKGDYLQAARSFLLWNKNDGQVMRGLTRRRMAEADLYDDPMEA